MDTYLIWSNEHRGWWKADGWGYSPGIRGAGQFNRDTAIELCSKALMTALHIGMISELPVRFADVQDMLKDQRVPEIVLSGKN